MDANIAFPAALIGDPTRAAILLALMDGRAQPASALARAASVSAQSASNHLARLTEGGLLVVEAQGRHRYYRLAATETATALEALAMLSTQVRPLREPLTRKGLALRFARTCYDHLAGQLGVAIADALQARGFTAASSSAARFCDVTIAGRRWLADMDIDVDALARGTRPLARRCLDWTERRHHLAGSLGSALLTRFEALDWLARNRETRAVRLTERGAFELHATLGIDTRALMELPLAERDRRRSFETLASSSAGSEPR